MSKFHSTVSRRDFMKGIGLAGAGLGAAAAAAPVFHDLDEVMSSPTALKKRPWWVKDREHDDPTVELDWDLLKPHDGRLSCQSSYVNGQYMGDDAWLAIRAEGSAFSKQLPGTKGNTLKDIALEKAQRTYSSYPYSNVKGGGTPFFAGPQIGPTPDDLGLTKWTGTHEEASRMVRAAFAFLGLRTAFTEMGTAGSKHRNLVYTHMRFSSTSTKYMGSKWPPPLSKGPRIDQEDIDEGYFDGEVVHIPNKELWKISIMIPMAREAWRTANPDRAAGIARSANSQRYRQWASNFPCTQEFMRVLGYMAYGGVGSGGQIVPSESSAVLGGNAEMGRHSEAAIDPEYGANHGYWTLVTDLPLAPDRPIDAGIFRFCHTCRRCADACPSGSISQESEPSWELPQPANYKAPNMNQAPGKKLFWTDQHSCVKYRQIYGCNICRPVCTFNVNERAPIHEINRSILSTTGLFNGFLWKMGEVFGYGLKDSEEWWDKSLPLYGYNTTVVASDGGY